MFRNFVPDYVRSNLRSQKKFSWGACTHTAHTQHTRAHKQDIRNWLLISLSGSAVYVLMYEWYYLQSAHRASDNHVFCHWYKSKVGTHATIILHHPVSSPNSKSCMKPWIRNRNWLKFYTETSPASGNQAHARTGGAQKSTMCFIQEELCNHMSDMTLPYQARHKLKA